MRLKIRYDGEFEKFYNFFGELNKAYNYTNEIYIYDSIKQRTAVVKINTYDFENRS